MFTGSLLYNSIELRGSNSLFYGTLYVNIDDTWRPLCWDLLDNTDYNIYCGTILGDYPG